MKAHDPICSMAADVAYNAITRATDTLHDVSFEIIRYERTLDEVRNLITLTQQTVHELTFQMMALATSVNLAIEAEATTSTPAPSVKEFMARPVTAETPETPENFEVALGPLYVSSVGEQFLKAMEGHDNARPR